MSFPPHISSISRFPDWTQLPSVYLPARNKGFDMERMIKGDISVKWGGQHPLPWYPPLCDAALASTVKLPTRWASIHGINSKISKTAILALQIWTKAQKRSVTTRNKQQILIISILELIELLASCSHFNSLYCQQYCWMNNNIADTVILLTMLSAMLPAIMQGILLLNNFVSYIYE